MTGGATNLMVSGLLAVVVEPVDLWAAVGASLMIGPFHMIGFTESMNSPLRWLLDVSFLIALLQDQHICCDRAHACGQPIERKAGHLECEGYATPLKVSTPSCYRSRSGLGATGPVAGRGAGTSLDFGSGLFGFGLGAGRRPGRAEPVVSGSLK